MNEKGDLVERIDAAAGEEAGFDVTGTAGVRVIGSGDLAPTVVDGLSAPAGSEKRLTITLEQGLSIEGRVFEPTGELWLGKNSVYADPLDAPWNVVHGEGWDEDSWGEGRWLVFQAGVHEDGTFEITGLVPGRYRVNAECRAEEYGSRDGVQIVEAGSGGVEIHLVRQACVNLRFVDAATGGQVTGVVSWEVTNEHDEEPWASGEMSSGGENRLWLRPGQRATLRAEADGYFPHEPVSIVAGESGDETEVACQFHPDAGVWADLDVLLRDEDGLPVTDMVVTRQGWRAVAGNEAGLYQLRVPAGSWYIRVDPDWPALQGLRTFWLPLGEEVQLERGGRARREWTVKRGGLIVARGEIEGSEIEGGPWLSVDGKRTEAFFRMRGGQDPEERSYVVLVDAGAYRVEARCCGRRVGIPVEVRAGEVTEVTFPPPARR